MHMKTMTRAALAAPLMACLLTAAPASAETGRPTEARAKIAVAFPKTYNRIETATLYAKYVQGLERCARVEMVNLRGDPIAERFDLVDILSESELLAGMKAGRLQLAQF